MSRDRSNGLRGLPPARWSKRVREARRGILLSDVEPEKVEWLWDGRIPRGKITVIDGDPGLGKSAFSTDLAARVSVGRAFPDGCKCPKAGVVLLNAEDGLADTIRPRLDAAGGDPSKVLALAEIPDEEAPDQDRILSIPEDLDVIEEGIERVDAALVVIDPLMAFLSGEANSHKDQDSRRALAPLKSLAERTAAAIVLVRHLNKTGGGNPLYRGGGSIGIIGAARSGLVIAADPSDPQEKRRVLAASKNNLAEGSPSLTFQVVSSAANSAARVEWLGGSDLSARQLLKAPIDDEEKTALEEAVELLREELSERPMAASQIKKDARAAGVAEKTLYRAKHHLRVKSHKESDGSWTWVLVEEETKDEDPSSSQDGQASQDGHLGHVASRGPENSAYLSEDGQDGQDGQTNRDRGEDNQGDHLHPGHWRNHPMGCECEGCLYGD